MGGYKGKVRKISGKVHFFLDISPEMLFKVCRIYGFVGLLAHPSSFLVIVSAFPCLLFLACPCHYSAAVFILCPSHGTMPPAMQLLIGVGVIVGRHQGIMIPPKCSFSRACMRAPISDFALFAFTTFTRFLFSATVYRQKRGSYDKKRGRFFEKSPTFFRLSPTFFSFAPTFFKIASSFTKNRCFVPFQLWQFFSPFASFFSIFSRLAALKYKRMFMRQAQSLLFQSLARLSVKVVKAKSAILQGVRAYAHARDLDFTFVYITISL